MKSITKTALVLAGLLSAGGAFAEPTGVSQSDTTAKHVVVGIQDGKASLIVKQDGVPVDRKKWATNQWQPFDHFASMAGKIFVPSSIMQKDKNDVYVANMYKMSGGIWNIIPMPDHSVLGRMSFAKVGNQDVWFGDWADVPSGSASGTAGTNYTVYYSGSNPTTNLPTSGTATYAVKGINNYVNANSPLLTGTFTADFGANTLAGAIANSNLTVAVNANINQADASFHGNAVANGTEPGKTDGQFFGDGGAALAGIADFGPNNPLNTAFGGSKN